MIARGCAHYRKKKYDFLCIVSHYHLSIVVADRSRMRPLCELTVLIALLLLNVTLAQTTNGFTETVILYLGTKVLS